MRTYPTKWVALLGASALAATGAVCLAGTSSADDGGKQAPAWPVIRQAQSSYSVDGFTIGYLPAELERYGINATSVSNRRGTYSQISWVRGPDQMYGRVAVIRSEHLKELRDLYEDHYSHLEEGELELLDTGKDGKAFGEGAYLAEETGDLFWLEEPGVAVTAHLQPDRWDRGELVRVAESVAPAGEGQESPEASEGPESGEAAEVPEDSGVPQEASASPEGEPSEDTGKPAGDEVAAPEGGQAGPAAEKPATEKPAADEPAAEKPAADEPAAEQKPVEGRPVGTGPDPDAPAEDTPATGQDGPTGDTSPVEESPEENQPAAGEQATEDGPSDGGSGQDAPAAGEPTAERKPTDEPTGTGSGPDAPAEDAPATGQEPAEDTPAEGGPSGSGPDGYAPGKDSDDVLSREVEQCLVGRFVDTGTGRSSLGDAELGEDAAALLEKVLAGKEPDGDERELLLAIAWHHGEEAATEAALDDCAAEHGIDRARLEAEVADEISDELADLAAGSAEPSEGTDTDGADGDLDAVTAEEWEELWLSLPWSYTVTP
ncbi:hypothetical protein [Nocardiopsis algeriensis]|uniref:PT repeat-containing protein n=1 Tax=Nocardiopsis algeriensis TaxID=1478215 RepID=A0A841IPC3_9ACTN|nr:hypothetical protein [Nocardiopsis algeriensis]MBB6120523.1 hypothetical protein [Nocardiopsis algeriensis]